MQRRGGVRGELIWGKSHVEKALGMLEDVAQVWTRDEDAHMGVGYEGFESLAPTYPAVQKMVDAIERASKELSRASGGLSRVRLAEAKSAASGQRLDNKLRRPIAAAFKMEGLDGNGRFRKAQHGYMRAIEVLHDYGIEMDQIVSSHHFNQDSGNFTIRLAYSNPEDPFSPTSITNSMLALSFHKMETGKFEVLAYLS